MTAVSICSIYKVAMVKCLFCDDVRMLDWSLNVRAQIFSIRRGAGRLRLNCWRKERTSIIVSFYVLTTSANEFLTMDHAIWTFALIVNLFVNVIRIQC